MRIAIVSDWYPPRLGGIEAQLGQLVTRLAAAGHQVTVITTTPGAARDGAVEVIELDVARLPAPPLAISPWLVPALRAQLRRGVDVVHAHVSVVSPVGWAGALAARSLGLPTAVTFHSVLRGTSVLLRTIGAVTPLASSCVAWSAVSGLVAGQASWGLHGAEVHVLPNGLDLAAWTAPRETPGDTVTLVSAMRLHRKKRGVALVRAFAEATRGAPTPARLVIVGEGNERDAIVRSAADWGVSRGPARVEVRGWTDPASLRTLYAEADAFVMASVHESFGIAALEARAAGLPVIARRSGNADFLRDGQNALLADTDRDLAAAMRQFLSDASLRQRLSRASGDLSHFDWPNVLSRHRREYERAVRLAVAGAQAVAPSG